MTGKRILVVDDEPRLQEMISIVLSNREYEVMTASNGEEAILMARTLEPDLILMDVMMPVMDGFTV